MKRVLMFDAIPMQGGSKIANAELIKQCDQRDVISYIATTNPEHWISTLSSNPRVQVLKNQALSNHVSSWYRLLADELLLPSSTDSGDAQATETRLVYGLVFTKQRHAHVLASSVQSQTYRTNGAWPCGRVSLIWLLLSKSGCHSLSRKHARLYDRCSYGLPKNA